MTTAGLLVAVVLWLATVAVALPVLVLGVQLVTATLRGPVSRRAEAPPPSTVGRLAVLMPAHDEAGGIVAPILAVLAQCRPGDRLLVVADNCSDATAAVARAAGAEVIERTDGERRGKGYALDAGVRWLERDPPAAVVVIDADCIVEPRSLERLAAVCLHIGRPVQALYLMRAPAGAGVGMRIAELAWLVKNQLRPRGFAAWGAPCPLMGSGMAFPWPVIQRAPLATGHLVEDMQLGLDLAAAGLAPRFCEHAAVGSVFPIDAQGAKSQRTRWEHGHLSVIARVAPRMIVAAIRRGDARLLAMALDLSVPPLASLVLLLAGVTGLDAMGWAAGAGGAPFAISVVAMLLLVGAVLMAWFREGRHIVSFADLSALPLYILAKVPVYVRLFTKRQVEWVRTRRDDRSNP